VAVQLSAQHSAVCGELRGVQAELARATELQKRAVREREELVRLNQHLEERVSALEREKNILEQDVDELRLTDSPPLFLLGG